jgi:hypothetical protein
VPNGEQMRVPGYAGFFLAPRALVVHPNGEFYVAELFYGLIRRLDSDGRGHYIAGAQSSGLAGGDGPIEELRVRSISALVVTPGGDLIVADNGNNRLLRIRDVAACPSDPRPQIAINGWRQGASFGATLSPGTIFPYSGKIWDRRTESGPGLPTAASRPRSEGLVFSSTVFRRR